MDPYVSMIAWLTQTYTDRYEGKGFSQDNWLDQLWNDLSTG